MTRNDWISVTAKRRRTARKDVRSYARCADAASTRHTAHHVRTHEGRRRWPNRRPFAAQQELDPTGFGRGFGTTDVRSSPAMTPIGSRPERDENGKFRPAMTLAQAMGPSASRSTVERTPWTPWLASNDAWARELDAKAHRYWDSA